MPRRKPVPLPTADERRLRLQAREDHALTLRLDGLSDVQIADELGYQSRQSAWRAWHRALVRTGKETPDNLRQIEAARLERLWGVVWPSAMLGDLAAVETAIQLSIRRSKLLGLEAPKIIQNLDDPNTVARLTEVNIALIIEAMRRFAAAIGVEPTRELNGTIIEVLRGVATEDDIAPHDEYADTDA